MQKNDVPGLLFSHPSIQKIVFPGNSLLIFTRLFRNWLRTGFHEKTGKCRIKFYVRGNEPHTPKTLNLLRAFRGSVRCLSESPKAVGGELRMVELVALPSTSPAYSAMRPPEKEKAWHQGCFRCKKSPPEAYRCAICEGKHWVFDCPTYQKTPAPLKKSLFPPQSELWCGVCQRERQAGCISHGDIKETAVGPGWWYR